MSGLETAIRNALDRSERTDAETRQRIYQSARNALDSGLKRQSVRDVTVITQQQHRLEALIQRIETEERAASETIAEPEPVFVAPDDRFSADPDGRPAPVFAATRDMPVSSPRDVDDVIAAPLSAERIDRMPPGLNEIPVVPPVHADAAVAAAPVRSGRLSSGDAQLDDVAPDRRSRLRSNPATDTKTGKTAAAPSKAAKPARRRRGFLSSLMMVVVTLAVILGAGAWWADSNGLLQPLLFGASDDVAGRAPGNPLDMADSFSANWIDVLKPADASGAGPGPDATANAVTDEDGARLAIVSRDAGPDGDVRIEVPAPVLAELSGKTSTIALTVRSTGAKPVEFSVECAFSTLGTCGRHRFTVLDEKVDMLVKVAFDRSLAPDAAGHLVINSDLSGAGAGLDLFAVRVLPGQ